jgi:hypothetical protein
MIDAPADRSKKDKTFPASTRQMHQADFRWEYEVRPLGLPCIETEEIFRPPEKSECRHLRNPERRRFLRHQTVPCDFPPVCGHRVIHTLDPVGFGNYPELVGCIGPATERGGLCGAYAGPHLVR